MVGSAELGAEVSIDPPRAVMHRVMRAPEVRLRPSVTSGRAPLCPTPTGLADGFGRQSFPTPPAARRPFGGDSPQKVVPRLHRRLPRSRVGGLDAAPTPTRYGRLR